MDVERGDGAGGSTSVHASARGTPTYRSIALKALWVAVGALLGALAWAAQSHDFREFWVTLRPFALAAVLVVVIDLVRRAVNDRRS